MASNDDIVITGIAGRYPECDSFDEFKEALLSGVDLVTENDKRFPPGIYETPRRAGKLNNMEYFDAGYFGITPRQSNLMDPRHRVMFETAFEAIVDSGYNPKELRGSKTGVYVGIGNFDTSEAFHQLENTNGYTIIGTCLGQLANRTSYCFDFKGPSFVLDTACSSGLYAFTHAVKAIEAGEINAAIVSAVSVCFNPIETQEFNSLNMLSKEGKCKVFSSTRDGYVRSEAIITVFLQKKSNCRRLYSTVLGAEVNCDGFKMEGITFPSAEMQLKLMKNLYIKKNLKPEDVSFVEMHGTGTPAGDEIECESVAGFFCKNRKTPLIVGAVKSNMGHSETSSGLCSLTKVLVAMETGIIPANLHCEDLDYTLPGIREGKFMVVKENHPWNGGMVSVNCFGFGGANAHLILESNKKPKLGATKKSNRLVNVSGRTEESVKYYLNNVQERQDDDEFLALVDEIHKMDVEGHPYRGYTVLGNDSVSGIGKVTREKRPIWFIYSGMGSQWPGMGKDLMKIDVFRNTFKRCANALKPYNIDLEHIVLTDDSKIFDDITNCFAAITATEIALTDLLRSLDIEPDGFVGHSLGEVGCAYCNGDLTPEEATLLGFSRGFASRQSKCAPGQMAAVGLSKEEISKYLPEGVYIACYNTQTSVTITGPKESVTEFVKHLTERGIFARLVNSANYAFHSKYLEDISSKLKEFVDNVIPNPKPRSSKWISSSWKESEWNNPLAKMNSSYYHYNNFKNPVLFDQVFKHIPDNAILIEVGPHGLLTSLMKKEVGPTATCLSLVNRNSKDNLQFLFSSLGKLFINGGQPNLRKFYDNVCFPVGRGTYNIGSLIKWDHSVKWFTPFFEVNKSFGQKVTVNTKTDKYSFLIGHKIDERVLMSATGYLEMVWKVAAKSISKNFHEVPVIFESVKFVRATVLPEGQDVVFLINIMDKSGHFEVSESGSVCCSGIIRTVSNVSNEFLNIDIPVPSSNGYIPLKTPDVYKLFHLKKYMYTGLFQGIELVDVHGTSGCLKWNNSYTAFLDTMLQITLVPDSSCELSLPTRLEKLVIDPAKHLLDISHQDNGIPVYYDRDLKLLKSGGIEITNLECSVVAKKHTVVDPVQESQVFVSYINESQETEVNLGLSLKLALQIIRENISNSKILYASEIISREENSLVKTIESIIKTEPLLRVSFLEGNTDKADFILCPDGYLDETVLIRVCPDGFIIYFGDKDDALRFGVPIVYQNTFKQKGIFLLRNVTPIESFEVVPVSNENFAWVNKAKEYITNKQILYLLSQNEDASGIIGLVKCMNLEPIEKTSAKCIFIQGNNNIVFSPSLELYKQQLSRKLTINVLKDGVWGSYRHISVNEINSIDVAHSCNYIQTIGDLTSFRWVERPSHYQRMSPDSEYVYVYYSALNFRDVMSSTGKVAITPNLDPCVPGNAIGFEYSGITQSGTRVMGVKHAPCLSLQVTTDPLFTWEVPESWSLEEAATIPVVYATCYYGMITRGQMKNGSSILIHAGAGGIGIAAISIALSMNCTVFTTCGTEDKKEFLLKMFPKLKRENIGNSRNTSFEQMIKRNTKGKGVDFVLNSLAADMFQASIRCVAQRGQFLEIGKVDLWAGTPISAGLFSKNTSFHGVLLDDLFDDTAGTKEDIHKLVTEGISKGDVRPLPKTVFTEDKVEDAFRFLSTGKHKGKVLIQIRSETENIIQSPERTIKAIPKLYFDPEKTYVLVGGLGGFGLELANYIIKRYAKKIVLNSRKGVTKGYQSLYLKKWSEIGGVTVKINNDDTSTLNGAESLMKFAEAMGPVGGIFNMAMVLQDDLFSNQTVEKFDSVFKSKIYSGRNLDQVTRKRCPKLDHFVVLSSIASGRGNAGQSNYGMANSAMERLCEVRRRDGLPALAVQYGPIGDVGEVSESLKYEAVITNYGLVRQPISSCLEALENFMLQPGVIMSTFLLDEQTSTLSSSIKSPSETIAHILGIRDLSIIDKNEALIQIGLDSLMIAEIKQTFYRNFNIELSIDEIRELTFNGIAEMFEKPVSTNEKRAPVLNGINGHQTININAMLKDEAVVEIINDKSYTKHVFLLHPIEGNVELLLPLAKNLNANVFGLQSTKNVVCDDMKTYAKHLIKEIRNVQKSGPYSLCGYSFGAALGFEVAVQLEKQNEKVNLFLLDGSPSFAKRILHHMYEKNKPEITSRINALRAFLNTFDEIDQNKANKIFDDSMPWKKNLERLGDFVAEHTCYNSKDIMVSAERYVERISAAFNYEPSDIFNGQATLVRSNDVFRELTEDYGLQQICKQPIKIETLEGDHKQILLGSNTKNISGIINDILSEIF